MSAPDREALRSQVTPVRRGWGARGVVTRGRGSTKGPSIPSTRLSSSGGRYDRANTEVRASRMRAPKNLALTILRLRGPVQLLLGLLSALILGVRTHGRTFHALLRTPGRQAMGPAQLVLPHSATLHTHLGHALTGSLAGPLTPGLGAPLAAGPGAVEVPGVVHHHHHHVVVLQGGGYPGDTPPSKEAMAALLQLPRTILGHQHHHPDTAMARSHTVNPPRVYQSVSTIGAGVTHQYHFHSAQDLAAAAAAASEPALPPPPPAPLPPALPPAPVLPAPTAAPAPTPFPQHDPDAEWYARQQASRVLALLGKLRDLGIHVDEVDDDPSATGMVAPPLAQQRPAKLAAPTTTPAPAPPPAAHTPHPDKQVEQVPLLIPHVVEDTGAHVGVQVDVDEDDEVMKKELVKYLIKVQKKHKELTNLDHAGDDGDLDGFSGWKSRSDEGGEDNDVVAGGDLDIDTDDPARSVLDEVVTLAAELGVNRPEVSADY
ncbi:uncharacterized protein LOC113208043 [Frankliniella occidentalis]|uniref:Uncharacterized protein LOC113208043 n=1 Tax=Frankliniella occidentalis TaxID=133901 RepID=A0A6J1SHG9_FRAOC|nr:uncharacterized protein LOC113208043 [Frankliniella occidentalis]